MLPWEDEDDEIPVVPPPAATEAPPVVTVPDGSGTTVDGSTGEVVDEGPEEPARDPREAIEDEFVSLHSPKKKDMERFKFEILDEGSAEWYVGRIVDLDEQIARIEKNAKTMLKRVNAQRKKLWDLYSVQLEEWAKKNLDRDKRSRVLLTGTVGFRRSPDKLVVLRKADTVCWAKMECKDAVKTTTTTTLAMGSLKAYHKKTGKLPLGTTWKTGEDKFYINK